MLVLALSFSNLDAKDCVGTIYVYLVHPDGTQESVDTYQGPYLPYYASLNLADGDSVKFVQFRTSYCNSWGPGGLRIRATPLGDTATTTSPVINAGNFATTIKLAQPGSFLIENMGTDYGLSVHVDIQATQVPHPIELLFTKSNAMNVNVPAGETCSGPCETFYLQDGQSVRMQALFGGLVQLGGDAIVRYAPTGQEVSFNSQATILPMANYEGFEFATEGLYLLSVEGPLFTNTGYAFIQVSYLPPPRLDMSLTIEHADGSTEEVAYIQASNYPFNYNSIQLGPGDSLRIDHHEITEPCASVGLQLNTSPDWSYANYLDPLESIPSTSVGIKIAAQGSYYMRHFTDCGIPTAHTYLYINPPIHALDLVVMILHHDSAAEEIFRSNVPLTLPLHLGVTLEPGDSIRVYSEETGYCGSSFLQIYKNEGPEDPEPFGPALTMGYINIKDFTFSGNANYLIRNNGGSCYDHQDLYLQISALPIQYAAMTVHLDGANNTSQELIYASATEGAATVFNTVDLYPDDSLTVHSVLEQGACNEFVLKGYRSYSDTATMFDPLFLDTALYGVGFRFHEPGTMLLTLEDPCGVITGSAHLNVTTGSFNGIPVFSGSTFNALFANDLLLINTETSGLLQVRNTAGQLVHSEYVPQSTLRHPIPFSGEARGIYIATMTSPSQVDVARFVVY